MTDDYNGWDNRDTYLVNLWLNNNEDIYNEHLGLVQVTDTVGILMSELHDLIWRGMRSKTITDKINLERVKWNELVEHILSEFKPCEVCEGFTEHYIVNGMYSFDSMCMDCKKMAIS